jgi:hypothetical protein
LRARRGCGRREHEQRGQGAPERHYASDFTRKLKATSIAPKTQA